MRTTFFPARRPEGSHELKQGTRVNEVVARRLATVDGDAWVKSALADIAARTKAGQKVRVVFDIDDTLVDTRARTLHLGRAFDKAHGTKYFANATIEDMRSRGETTAKALKLPEPLAKEFVAYWNEAFWH